MLDRPKGSKPTSPAIDPSRSGGRLRKGKAVLFSAIFNDDDEDEDTVTAAAAAVFAMGGVTKADAVPTATRRVVARVVFIIMGIGSSVRRGSIKEPGVEEEEESESVEGKSKLNYLRTKSVCTVRAS
jgi:hypothetical protein